MRPRYLALAGAATLLSAGAAQAQLGTSATPNTGVAPNRTTPAPYQPGTTGIPSPDSTNLTGYEAGRTSLPNGLLSGGTGASMTFAPRPRARAMAAETTAPPASAREPEPAPAPTPPPPESTPSAAEAAANVSATPAIVTNGPVPDTPENRRKYGGPMSRAGKRTAPIGN